MYTCALLISAQYKLPSSGITKGPVKQGRLTTQLGENSYAFCLFTFFILFLNFFFSPSFCGRNMQKTQYFPLVPNNPTPRDLSTGLPTHCSCFYSSSHSIYCHREQEMSIDQSCGKDVIFPSQEFMHKFPVISIHKRTFFH